VGENDYPWGLTPLIDPKLIERLYRQARAERWRTPKRCFADALAASATRAFAGQPPGGRDLERHLASLHLEDLALACACAAGNDEAWECFIREQRPLLYRAADALDPSGGARELADSLYADLFGLRGAEDERRSLFRYFHGRSSLTTWLRAVLAQRHVDWLRTTRRTDPWPDDESAAAVSAPSRPIEPDRDRYAGLMREALALVLQRLQTRDRLRLTCYYVQELTLSQTGRILGEHEATASRQLARTRRDIRAAVEQHLLGSAGLADAEIARCFEYITEDTGALDLQTLLGAVDGRKESGPDRSNEGDVS
jgi:RNA polymerase sigma-70 factor (ECF subfamily)